MKNYEFESYSVGDALLFEMHKAMVELNLLENNDSYNDYFSFINQEKSHTIDQTLLKKNQEYYPLGLQAIPAGRLILIKFTKNSATYLDSKNGKLYFNLDNKIIDFPITGTYGDGLLETLVYSSSNEQQQFITNLRLKFSDWNLRTNIL